MTLIFYLKNKLGIPSVNLKKLLRFYRVRFSGKKSINRLKTFVEEKEGYTCDTCLSHNTSIICLTKFGNNPGFRSISGPVEDTWKKQVFKGLLSKVILDKTR